MFKFYSLWIVKSFSSGSRAISLEPFFSKKVALSPFHLHGSSWSVQKQTFGGHEQLGILPGLIKTNGNRSKNNLEPDNNSNV